MKKYEILDGNSATERIAYAMTEFASIYPITPSTPMAELYEKHSARKHSEKLTMPIRFYHGIDDPVMQISEMYELQKLLKNHHNAQFHAVPGTHDAPIPFFGEAMLGLLEK